MAVIATAQRKRGWNLFVVLGIWFALLVNTNASLAARPDMAKERLEAFEWFGGLGFPDVKTLKFVRVTTGWPDEDDYDPLKNSYLHGFLLSQEEDTFSVLLPDLETRKWRKTPPGTKDHQKVEYEVADLSKYAASRLESIRDIDQRKRKSSWRSMEMRLSERAQVFTLAWSCWRKGHDELAAELYDEAARMGMHSGSGDSEIRKVRQRVAVDLGHAEMWRAVEEFGEAGTSRVQLLDKFRGIIKNYPECEHIARAKTTVELLEKMVQEDLEHTEQRKRGKSFEELSEHEQIRELVFQLRDQNGRQMSQPGSCDVFFTLDSLLGHAGKSPAHQLVKFGYAAVPQLVDALGDRRFSRSVGCHRNFYFSHHVLTVGECARQVLDRIDGRGVDHVATLARLKEKGERQILLEEVAVGDKRVLDLAGRLVSKYPDAAFPALAKATRLETELWVRAYLVNLCGSLTGDEPLPFLLEEMKQGPHLMCRLPAAKAVHQRGRPEAVAAMIAEWNRPQTKPDADDERSDELASFLARCGKIEAIAALAKDFVEQPLDLRIDVLVAFSRHGDSPPILRNPYEPILPDKSKDKELRTPILRLLLTALEDEDELVGFSNHWGDTEYHNPRVCDLAGFVLHGMDAKRYPCDLSAPLEQRERDRFAVQNLVRQELGLAAVSSPGPRVVKPVAAETLRPLLERFEKASPEELAEAQSPIIGLGLGALPAVVKRRAALAPDEPGRARLDVLARRLSLMIAEVQFAKSSLKPPAALADRLASLQGRPFDPRAFQDLLAMIPENLPDGAHGVRLSAVRGSAGMGMLLQVELLTRQRARALNLSNEPYMPERRDRPTWIYGTYVRAGQRVVGHSISWEQQTADNKEEFLEWLEQAAAAPYDQPLEIRLQWAVGRVK